MDLLAGTKTIAASRVPPNRSSESSRVELHSMIVEVSGLTAPALPRYRGRNVKITVRTIVQRQPEALSADTGTEGVLMSVEHGKFYGLGGVGWDIWRRLDHPMAVGPLCAELAVEYAADPAIVENDTVALIEQLVERHFLDPVPEPMSAL